MPAVEFSANFRGCDIVHVPVIEGEEKDVKKHFPVPLFAKLSGKKGESLQVVKNNQIFRFVGMGPKKEVNSRAMRRFLGTAYLSSLGMKPKAVGIECPLEWVKEAGLGIHVAALNPAFLKSKPVKQKAPKVVIGSKLFGKQMPEAKKALKVGLAVAEGKNLMRILGALPPNLLHPQSYAELVVELAKKWGVHCKRLTEKEREPYQLLRAVSHGSGHDSELLVLTLNPKEGPTKKSVAVIGKGLCYDSGGLQDKQMFMKSMKEDMAGSASVLGTILAILKSGSEVKQTTHFMLGLAENMMGDHAMRADDIYIAGDGQTVEVANTDAEGRLVLGDVICYAKKELKGVERYFTIATLTGHCLLALGDIYTGMIVNRDDLSKETIETGRKVGEYVYPAPWDMEYDDNGAVHADIINLSDNSREGGWIKAGLYLYRFVPKAKDEKDQVGFCHLDIAGSIDMHEKGKSWRQKGLNSGVGVGLLMAMVTK